MKICFLAPANNYHTHKWCEYFTSKGYIVDIISFVKGTIDNVNVHYIDCNVLPTDSDIKKLKYLLKVKEVKKIIKEIKPDIINAHYATSYGMVASLCNIPYILSIWGTDVYRFPRKSFIHRLYFKYILNKAKCICSTSESMAKEINKYTSKEISITPFGVKMDIFKPIKNNNKEFIVGTVKSLEDKYGIKYLIDSIEIINNTRPDINIKVRIAGSGSKEKEYKQYAKDKHVKVDWLGYISQEDAAIEWSRMNVAIISSLYESFGVSAIEAQASGVPVIISEVDGLLETTKGTSRIVVPKEDALSIANAIIKLYDNPKLRTKMGISGRKYVENKYEYNKCFNRIERVFKDNIE